MLDARALLKAAMLAPLGLRELVLHTAVVGAAAAILAWRGFHFSLQFEHGHRWDGYAPGLQPGWLWGRIFLTFSGDIFGQAYLPW